MGLKTTAPQAGATGQSITTSQSQQGTAQSGISFLGTKQGFYLQTIPAGKFMMGNDSGPGDEKPVREIFISSFMAGRTEITNRQFAAVYDEALAHGLLEADAFLVNPKGQEDKKLVGFTSAGANRGLEFKGGHIVARTEELNDPCRRISPC